MKKIYLILAAAVGMTITSCTSNDFLGDVDPNAQLANDGAIRFGYKVQGTTRAEDISGDAAAALLGNNFYVMGTKGIEPATSPTTIVVFDNYLVHYDINTAGKTTSNTANWEYVGITPGTSPVADYPVLSSLDMQTIKYWDYSAAQYDFLAFSTGEKTPVTGKAIATVGDDEINVTAINYGSALGSTGTAYTFGIPTIEALENAFISDITEVKPGSYGKDVTLKFKNLGTKVRMALYETVPGYSVKDVRFYTVDKADASVDDLGSGTVATANLIGANNNSFPTKGTIEVYFPHVGTTYEEGGSDPQQDYDIAAARVTPADGTYNKYKDFGAIPTAQLQTKEHAEKDAGTDKLFLGRSLPEASFAGSADANFYKAVFPNSVGYIYPITLRVDYTLVPIDGAAETITVKGAKAVVPATYTKWLPNYAYTYVFKISDNTNGWTGTVSQPAGLFPITFDAVVAEATEPTGEQTTVTTVATPTITTYQQGHTYATNEYSHTGNKLYVQVMDNKVSPAVPVGATACTLPALSSTTSLLYAVSDADATEAEVMDALENRTTAIDDNDVTGRNTIVLTKNSNILSPVTTIENGVDDNPITLTAATDGHAAEITIGSLTAGTYAYVYDYTSTTKNTVNEFQPISVTGSTVGESGKTYYTLTTEALNAISPTTSEETVSNAYIYFSKTTNGGATTTYSYISISGKSGMTLPAGVVKVAKTSITTTVAGGSAKVADTFYFDKYITNDGKYAVKVIKVV